MVVVRGYRAGVAGDVGGSIGVASVGVGAGGGSSSGVGGGVVGEMSDPGYGISLLCGCWFGIGLMVGVILCGVVRGMWVWARSVR